jgi:hypothetical protein
MMDFDDLNRFTQRTLRGLRTMSPGQRTGFVEEILHADPALAPILPQLPRSSRACAISGSWDRWYAMPSGGVATGQQTAPRKRLGTVLALPHPPRAVNRVPCARHRPRALTNARLAASVPRYTHPKAVA